MEQQRSLKTAQQQQLEEGEEIQHRPSPVEQLQTLMGFQSSASSDDHQNVHVVSALIYQAAHFLLCKI
ncbi:hypothetical protein Q3G72_000891 [Acer saccharum]|nr:hypothetical protein Q3G72_000891 [Acer saccharum]